MAAGKPGRISWQIRFTSSEMTPERMGWLFSMVSGEPEKEIPLLIHIIAGIRFSGVPELPIWGSIEMGAEILGRLSEKGVIMRTGENTFRLNEEGYDFSWLHSRNPRTDTVLRSRNGRGKDAGRTLREVFPATGTAVSEEGRTAYDSAPEGGNRVLTKLTEKVNKVDKVSTKLTEDVNKVDKGSTKLTENCNNVTPPSDAPSEGVSEGYAESCPNTGNNGPVCIADKGKGAHEVEDMSENGAGEGKNPSSLSLPVSLPSSTLPSTPPISTTSLLSTYSYLPEDTVGKEYTEVKKGGSYIRLPKKEEAHREGSGLQGDARTAGDEEGKRSEHEAMTETEGAIGSSSSQCDKASADGDYLPGLEPESSADSAPGKPSVPSLPAGSSSPLRPPAASPGKAKLTPELARDLWNENCPDLQRVAGMSVTSSRYRHFVARVNEAGLDEVVRVMKAANASPFFVRQRQGGHGWQCTFDWLMLPTNFWKTADGAYANDWSAQPRAPEEPQFKTTDYFIRKNAQYTEEDARRINERNFAKIGVKSFKQFALNAIKAKKEAEKAGEDGKGERA